MIYSGVMGAGEGRGRTGSFPSVCACTLGLVLYWWSLKMGTKISNCPAEDQKSMRSEARTRTFFILTPQHYSALEYNPLNHAASEPEW